MHVTTVTRDLHLADWRENIWSFPFNPNIFVYLCCTIVMPVCVAFCKVLQGYVKLCPWRVRWFKKIELLIQEWNISLLTVKDLHVFELKFLYDDLGNFSTTSFQLLHFSCKICFNSVSYRKLVSLLRDVCCCQAKKLFPSKDSTQPDNFLLHKEELASYPVLFLLLHWTFSAGL